MLPYLLIILLLFALAGLSYLIWQCVLLYRDARKRGKSPWEAFWTALIAGVIEVLLFW